MGKKDKSRKHTESKPLEGERPREPLAAVPLEGKRPREPLVTETAHDAAAEPSRLAGTLALQSPNEPPPKTRLRRLLPDIIKVVLALFVIGLAIAVWLKPPLLRDTSPYVSYTFGGKTSFDAVLYRPLSVPARFYVGLPEKLDGRYQWFTVDKLREIAALADGPPQDTFLWWPAVRRNAPLGLDLEFRTIDGAEWQVFFFKDAIVFSNNVLSVRLDTKKPAEATGDSR